MSIFSCIKNLKKGAAVVTIIIAALLFVLYGVFDPAQHPFPKCPFYLVSGWKCPGCGSQRAIHQLIHLKVESAFEYNALLVLFIPVVSFLIVADAMKSKYPNIYLISRNPVLSWGILVIILLWWILRNLCGW